MTLYQVMISRALRMMRREDVNPVHVEAYMREGHGSLDDIRAADFARWVRHAVDHVDEYGIDCADELAASCGLLERPTVECHHCNRLGPDRPPPPVDDDDAWELEARQHEFGCYEVLTRGGQRANPVKRGEIWYSGTRQERRAAHG